MTPPIDTDLAHQLGRIAERLDTIGDDVADIKARVHHLELAEARHSSRLALVMSGLGAMFGMAGAYVLDLLRP